MHLVSWNCHDGFAKKSPALLALKPDIAVLSEVKKQDLENIQPVASIAFAGDSLKKGVAVVGWNGWQMEQSATVEGKWFLPVVAKRGSVHIHILAVWVKPTTNYVAPTINELVRRKELLANDSVIVAGDFNHNVMFDKGRRGNRRFAAALDIFAKHGLVSAWHDAKNESHGNESMHSLFLLYDKQRGYHIDYAFLSKTLLAAVSDVKLGSYEDWVKTRLSDHVPLSVTFDFSRRWGH